MQQGLLAAADLKVARLSEKVETQAARLDEVMASPLLQSRDRQGSIALSDGQLASAGPSLQDLPPKSSNASLRTRKLSDVPKRRASEVSRSKSPPHPPHLQADERGSSPLPRASLSGERDRNVEEVLTSLQALRQEITRLRSVDNNSQEAVRASQVVPTSEEMTRLRSVDRNVQEAVRAAMSVNSRSAAQVVTREVSPQPGPQRRNSGDCQRRNSGEYRLVDSHVSRLSSASNLQHSLPSQSRSSPMASREGPLGSPTYPIRPGSVSANPGLVPSPSGSGLVQISSSQASTIGGTAAQSTSKYAQHPSAVRLRPGAVSAVYKQVA